MAAICEADSLRVLVVYRVFAAKERTKVRNR